MKLEGKIAIVTGGGRDIGRACALRLAEEGADVAISYHASAAGAEETIAEIRKAGRKGLAVKADLSTEEGVQTLVGRCLDAFGRVDILVNNAGGLVGRKTIAEMPMEHWQRVIDLNLTSVFRMVKACLPHMESGAIINIASQAGRDGGGPGAVAYATAKGAVMTMTRGLAKELGPAIRVNGVCPGMIDTDFHNIFTSPEVREKVARSLPLKREGTPRDVANLVAFLASEDAAYMTGANVDINGGALFS